MNVPTGRPVGTTEDAGFNASTDRPTGDIDIEMKDVLLKMLALMHQLVIQQVISLK